MAINKGGGNNFVGVTLEATSTGISELLLRNFLSMSTTDGLKLQADVLKVQLEVSLLQDPIIINVFVATMSARKIMKKNILC